MENDLHNFSRKISHARIAMAYDLNMFTFIYARIYDRLRGNRLFMERGHVYLRVSEYLQSKSQSLYLLISSFSFLFFFSVFFFLFPLSLSEDETDDLSTDNRRQSVFVLNASHLPRSRRSSSSRVLRKGKKRQRRDTRASGLTDRRGTLERHYLDTSRQMIAQKRKTRVITSNRPAFFVP